MVQIGNVYRKAGPCDWVKIVRVQMPGHENYDGGLPGCSVRFSTGNGGFERRTWFYPAIDDADFERKMKESCCELVTPNGPHERAAEGGPLDAVVSPE